MQFGLPDPAPPGRSPVERLLEVIQTHVTEEADSLVAYQRLAETTDDRVVGLLMRLVLEDEKRHHGLMQQLAASLYDGLHWTHSANALLDGTRPPAPGTGESAAAVRVFAQEERKGARELKELARQSARLNDGLDSLLLEIMAMDSQKHERILRFIARRLGSGAERRPAPFRALVRR